MCSGSEASDHFLHRHPLQEDLVARIALDVLSNGSSLVQCSQFLCVARHIRAARGARDVERFRYVMSPEIPKLRRRKGDELLDPRNRLM
jgi:hypothetical protein